MQKKPLPCQSDIGGGGGVLLVSSSLLEKKAIKNLSHDI